MALEKKMNLNDHGIQIRILKALADIKPFGAFKHFYMVRILRNLKQPNIITAKYIWDFLSHEYDISKYDEIADSVFKDGDQYFDNIFDD